MSKELCDAIDFTDKNVVFDQKSKNYTFKDDIFKVFCSLGGKGGKGQCNSAQKLSSGFMGLLEYFKSIEDENLDGDKLAQYAILWFSYKISQNPKIEIAKNTMYDVLTQNEWFNEHSESIEKIKDMMNFHFIHLKNLYEFLKGICETINKCNGSSNTNECIESAKKCADSYRTCLNSFPWGELCNPYCSVLSNLKKDYEKFRKNHNNLPKLEPPKGRENCENYCKSLTQILNAEKSAIEQAKQITTHNIGLLGQLRILTGINNGNKLLYIAIPFILIPIILGISYKYLTPVWRKMMKRKTMKKIINSSDQKKAQNGFTNAFIEKNQSE
ncbi:CIR protein [Plasmodium chabaudi chabaudi]|uniref:CIR protein n=1 Tax=Plasmodium chabaudi chabaudi TaxID=31271 RepID=A0A4V0K3W8_PLACU|nr:CIR protein [Plasmodium chabaudi chabaudi]VTZ67600.1 CIR protein [Plasmodium chabaudi chabaudi]|eukprot:XP_016653365.1 CIR protein [Plasmodium chabaudi chabaudi]